jgi:hypothetical protein
MAGKPNTLARQIKGNTLLKVFLILNISQYTFPCFLAGDG